LDFADLEKYQASPSNPTKFNGKWKKSISAQNQKICINPLSEIEIRNQHNNEQNLLNPNLEKLKFNHALKLGIYFR
jgi:hypothetical protein